MILAFVTICFAFSSCATANTINEAKTSIDSADLKRICALSTIECKTHSFVEGSKKETTWLVFKKEYHYICEYDGKYEIGVDFYDISLDEKKKTITVSISEPYLQSISVDNTTLDKYDVLAYDKDWLYLESKKLDLNDYNNSLAEAQKELTAMIERDRLNYDAAEENAKQLITNYIEQMCALDGVSYSIRFDIIDK